MQRNQFEKIMEFFDVVKFWHFQLSKIITNTSKKSYIFVMFFLPYMKSKPFNLLLFKNPCVKI